MNNIKFRDITINSAFTPATGQVGEGNVYIKSSNGACNHLGTESYGVFYPNDLVRPLKIPAKFLTKNN